MSKKDTPVFDKLSPRKKKFVMEHVTGKSAIEAVVAAGYSPTPSNVSQTAVRVANDPNVQRAITEIIMDQYPNAGEEVINVLKSFIRDETLSASQRMAAIDRLASYQGWAAPKKSQSVKALVDLSKYKLPGSK